MDAYDLMATVHDELSYASDGRGGYLGSEDGFKGWSTVALNQGEVERVGRSLAALFGITLD